MRALAVAMAFVTLAAAGCRRPRKAPLECKRPVQITAEVGSVWWFGEMHGTVESPTFVGDVACSVAQGGHHVQIGLEIWNTEQPAIDKFLTTGDKARLLAGPFWAQHDGRSTTAMLDLLDRVYWLRRAGANVDIVAYDVTTQPDRDEAMAIKVLSLRDAKGVFVGLSGNIHSRRTKWNDTTPLIMHLVGAKLPVRTHDVSAAGGSMWSCMATPGSAPECGEHAMRDDGATATPWTLGPPRDDSHDGVYYVGTTTAAFPARP